MLEKINTKIKIKKLLCDNGGEFRSKEISLWCEKNKIELSFSIPYYHESNGRVERVNRTLRESLKKNKGSLKIILDQVVENYNNTSHRGIGTTPKEALKPENRETVKLVSRKYKQEFGGKKVKEVLEIGDRVYIKNEVKKNKMDNEFNEQGEVICREGDTSYKVRNSKGRELVRHISQLRLIR